MNIRGKKIFVGLSGGVDSAVTAALLKEAGAEVVGVFIKGWYPAGLPCTWAADRRDAMRVAARLHIPFHTLDASIEYKKSVIDYLVHEYSAGRTPNPDIMCNRDVKFGVFFRFAREHGADFIATGHYARVEKGVILRGLDSAKDQSYFLWAIDKEVMPCVLFPLGGMKKDLVRQFARTHKLPVARKKDSQGICFLGNVSIEDFLRTEVGLSEGEALDEEGTVVGTHSGVIAYTLGERAALGGTAIGPWYVVRKDLERNTLTVAHRPAALPETRSGIRITQTNRFGEARNGSPLGAQYRYHGPIIQGSLSSDWSTFTPNDPLTEQLAAGQSLVFYDQDVLIGGGIID